MKQSQTQTLAKEETRVDVTKEMKKRCYHKTKGYENTIEKVEKIGNTYFIKFAEGYAAFCQKERKARKIAEVQWYSRIALEQKDTNKKAEDYIKEFLEHNIICDGKTIPEFIDIEKSTSVKETKKVDKSQNNNKKEKISKAQ